MLTLSESDRAEIERALDEWLNADPDDLIDQYEHLYLAGLRAGLERAAKACETPAPDRLIHDPPVWNNCVLIGAPMTAEECAAAIRATRVSTSISGASPCPMPASSLCRARPRPS